MLNSVKEKTIGSLQARNVGIELLMWASLPNLEVLKTEPTQVVVRTHDNGLITVFTYTGLQSDMHLHYEFAMLLQEASISQLLTKGLVEKHLMVKILIKWLQERGCVIDLPQIDEYSERAMIMGLSYVAVQIIEGDQEAINAEIEKQQRFIDQRCTGAFRLKQLLNIAKTDSRSPA